MSNIYDIAERSAEVALSTSPDQAQSKPEVPCDGVDDTRRVSGRRERHGESARCSRSSSVRCARVPR